MQIGFGDSVSSALSQFSNVAALSGVGKIATAGKQASTAQAPDDASEAKPAQPASADIPSGRRGSLVNLLV